MSEFWLTLVNSFTAAFGEAQALTAWEAVAVLLAVAYLILAMKGNIWCWAAAFISTAIYTVLFWKVSLLMESVLNVYYMAMAIYGYWMWTRGGREHDGVNIVSWRLSTHLKLIGMTTLIAIAVGHFMATQTQAAFPYLDAATTCFAVMTTYLVAKKVLENWIYWFVIDAVSIYLYVSKGLMLTAILFVLYIGMVVFGYVMWRNQMKEQQVSNDIALSSGTM
ncbi:nicotinamide riboside transporter PnuC [Shewanella schlegeliana]|uniref:Nicotinamide riboside transporter PnuC n=1 Tax=Shewanella schlegeliana TaxID=190308 RepID=A0ABS1T5K1_9GAMM|nr:nicotinamide riboside transporter PnuC [Shewanella schlegeliana]MBL4915107.1 nicotinamide mononucleotide transporter [Shewanella schlegeliana]MCL1111027.1 nicotinamide riboside transporter PnuC [Shewanella schlegeliana]GIU29145.1 nicotinamide mononucleotide transporter [Shewanella schlegeliana]